MFLVLHNRGILAINDFSIRCIEKRTPNICLKYNYLNYKNKLLTFFKIPLLVSILKPNLIQLLNHIVFNKVSRVLVLVVTLDHEKPLCSIDQLHILLQSHSLF